MRDQKATTTTKRPMFARARTTLARRFLSTSVVETQPMYVNESRRAGEVNVDVPVPADFKDLADVPHPIGAFAAFNRPNCYNDPSLKLSPAQLADYERDGFIAGIPVSAGDWGPLKRCN